MCVCDTENISWTYCHDERHLPAATRTDSGMQCMDVRASQTSVVHPPASDLNVLALHSSTPPTLSNPSHRFASSLSSNVSPAVYLIRLAFGFLLIIITIMQR